MAKRKPIDFNAIRAASGALSGKDRVSEARRDAELGERVLVPLASISRRERSTRETNEEHVLRLAESIRELGLIEPLAVDRRLRLLAGGHRLAAIERIGDQDPEAFARWFGGGVPVWMLDFDADEDPERALSVEIAENEHRRDYTREEARQLAERLREAGFRDTVGRPKQGEKALAPALTVVLGKSLRTVRRLLDDEPEGTAAAPVPTEEAAIRGVLRALRKHGPSLPQQLQPAVNELVGRLAQELEREQ